MMDTAKRFVFAVTMVAAAFQSGISYEDHGKINILDIGFILACGLALVPRR
jgi:hypothetical protein